MYAGVSLKGRVAIEATASYQRKESVKKSYHLRRLALLVPSHRLIRDSEHRRWSFLEGRFSTEMIRQDSRMWPRVKKREGFPDEKAEQRKKKKERLEENEDD